MQWKDHCNTGDANMPIRHRFYEPDPERMRQGLECLLQGHREAKARAAASQAEARAFETPAPEKPDTSDRSITRKE